MRITKKVTVVIEDEEFVRLLIEALAPKAKSAKGKELVLFRCLSYLIGIPTVESVRMANKYAANIQLPKITTDEFRKWLPEMLSETFKEFVGD